MNLQDALLRKFSGWSRGREQSAGAHASVYVSRGAVACAVAHTEPDLHGSLTASPIAEMSEITPILRNQVKQLGAARLPCNLVLAPEFYSMQLIERPDVPADELREAVRWQLQEQVDFSIETAVLDTFPMPKAGVRHSHMIFAVALPQELVNLVVGKVQDAGLSQLRSVDVAELAMRNLSWRCFPMADQSVGLLRLTSNSGLINVSRGEDLYLSRQISGVPDDFSDANWEQFRERMLVQVQRCLDYYQSAMGQPECDLLMVACTHAWTDRVTEYLTEMLPMPVRSVHQVLEGGFKLQLYNPEPVQIAWDALSADQTNAISAGMLALGGALRDYQVQPQAEVA